MSNTRGFITSIFLGLLLSANAVGHEISQKNLQTHVSFLCSDLLEGRLTGSIGEKRATQYIANQFQLLGLEPAGDNGTYFQEFDFTVGQVLGKNNDLAIVNSKGIIQHLILGKEWSPLSFSVSTEFKGAELIFVGYGITVPPSENLEPFDSYHGINVKNKWVVVFRGVPDNLTDERNHQLSQFSSLRYKTFVAKDHGAKGIIFVSEPHYEDKLIPFSSDSSLSEAGIPALSVKYDVLKSFFIKGSQTQVTGSVDIKTINHVGRNVLAKLTLSGVVAGMVVVGAHVDHLGRGKLTGSRALANEVGMVHSGADDNASGVASVLEVAAALSDLKLQGSLSGNKDILFAAWSGEELGLLGSSHFVKDYIKKSHNKSLRPTIDTVINLDMVGHLRKGLILQGIGSSSDWSRIIESAKLNHPIPLITQSDPYLPTDSLSFYLYGVPTLNLFTGAHDNYHSPRDKPETLNYTGIKNISEFLVDLVQVLEKSSRLVAYNEIQKTNVNPDQKMRIYLGTIPDYTSTDSLGVRLSGVAKNSPAANAGIQRNDVVVELAGKSIHDIYDYTFVMNMLPVNKQVSMVVLRGQTKMALVVSARYRE